jgi:protein required for attachment to host cells
MTNPRIHRGDWVVVCDGAKALVLQNVGDSGLLNLETREVHQQDDPKTSELGTDRPGRAMSSVGAGRSAMEEVDWHEQSERDFLVKLAGRLDAAAANGDIAALVLVAPPRALGLLRQTYSAPLRKALKGEIEKDYVNLPIDQIERHLVA